MKTQAIIFDLDGTAVDSPQYSLPSRRLVNAIRKAEKEYFICAATGRVWSFANEILQALSLKDPCIISGGSQICNPKTGEILWQSNIPDAALHKALEIFKDYSKYKILYNDYTTNDYFNGGYDAKDLEIKQPVYFLEQVFIPKKEVQQIVDRLNKIEGIAVVLTIAQKPGMNDIQIMSSAATKEHSVAELLNRIGVNATDTIGIGDGHNDIHLFNAVGHKVAMSNGVPEVKDLADEITDDIKDDGMAKYLERLVA